MKPKANTLLERFGFRDDELGTSDHDKLMLWLSLNVEAVGRMLYPNDKPWTEGQVSVACELWNNRLKARHRYPCDDEPNYLRPSDLSVPTRNPATVVDGSVKWEVPIKTGKNNFIVGLIDMEVVYEVDWGLSVVADDEWGPKLESSGGRSLKRIRFEVKTSIPSVGERLRQCNTYGEFMGSYHGGADKLAVVSLDDRWKEVIETQGMAFVRPWKVERAD